MWTSPREIRENLADITASEQLAARNFFVPIAHESLGATLSYPGPFAKLSATPLAVAGRAPYIGEHNSEVYNELLGYSKEKLLALRAVGAI